jgi:uncharacterized membrane protein YfcA
VLPLLLLCAVAFAAGVIDAIAGGGGLLTVPSLLLVTGTPRLALGTNKGQSVFGAFASLVSYHRAGRVNRSRAVPSFLAALAGSLVGVRLVLTLRPELLRPVVLGLLIGVAIFFAARGTRARKASPDVARLRWKVAEDHPVFTAGAIGLVMGAYDGFFGPGTGAFLIVLFTTIFGDDLVEATANAKVANFASNLGSVVSFAAAGAIDFRLALPMAVAQATGGIVGARAALRGGERLIRAGVVVVTIALAVRIAWQMSR